MKKLFVATAAIALAVATQAASINWSLAANSWTMSDGSKPAKGTTVYLIDAAQWSTIQAAIDGGATSFSASDAGIIAVGSTSNTKGYIADHTSESTKLTAGTTYSFAYMVFDTAANQFYASATKSVKAYDPTDAVYSEVTSVDFDSTNFTTTGLSGGWSTAGGSGDIPEPTSGILLLVGAGMLALRRKQK